jgi:small subunit ribosomal protein S16
LAVRVRLTRVGSKRNPIWRVVVADGRAPRDGRFIEMIGHYNPQTEPSQIVIDRERLQHWLDRGALPSNTVRKLMRAEERGVPAPAEVAVEAESEEAVAGDAAEATPDAAEATPDGTPVPEAAAEPEAAVAAPAEAEATEETEAGPEAEAEGTASTGDGEPEPAAEDSADAKS